MAGGAALGSVAGLATRNLIEADVVKVHRILTQKKTPPAGLVNKVILNMEDYLKTHQHVTGKAGLNIGATEAIQNITGEE